MQAHEIMQQSVLTATPDMSLALAWRLMEDHRIRHLPVVVDHRLIGIVTDRDIRRASLALNTSHTPAEMTYHMGTTAIETCMTRDIVTTSPEADIRQGVQQMLAGHVGCLPVLSHKQLVGIITEIDLLGAYLIAAATMQRSTRVVQEAMQELMIVVTPEDLVSTAYQRMQGGVVRHLPVLDEANKLVGVITDRDIRLAGNFDNPELPAPSLSERFAMMTVDQIMTTQVYTVWRHTPLTEAAELFLTHKFGCLPVIHDDATVAGILTVTDVLCLYVAMLGSEHTTT